MKKLGEILSDYQVKEVVRILQGESDPIKRVQKLEDYLGTFSEALLKKGVVVPYLAYAIELRTTGNEGLFNKLVEHIHNKQQNQNN